MNSFHEMGLSPLLLQTLDKAGFTQPTAIQALAVPLALQNKDIMGSAQTGTGKTMAFALPLINQLLTNPTGAGLILLPTRELAQQVLANINQLLVKGSPIRTTLIIGGEPYAKQLSQLRQKPSIVIGTPGRVIDHLGRGTLKADAFNFLVLDETDRMFDMGFSIQLEQIIKQLPTERQTLMFSATFPSGIERLAAKYMRSPERIFVQEIQDAGVVANNLTQETIEMKEGGKYEELVKQLDSREGTILVFVKTKDDADSLDGELGRKGYDTCTIHGNLRQNKRERVMRAFRQGKHRIMIATDIVARGLDVPHVKHVINYHIPDVPEDYVHRIGRTARAGATGSAVSFVAGSDRRRWQAIQALVNPSAADKIANKEGRGFSQSSRPFERNKRPFGSASSFNRDGQSNSREGRFNREGQSSSRPGQFGNREGQAPNREGQFGNREGRFNREGASFGNREGQAPKREGQFGNREGRFNREGASFGNREGQVPNREGQFGNREGRFNREGASFGNREGQAPNREGQFGNREGRFNREGASFGNREGQASREGQRPRFNSNHQSGGKPGGNSSWAGRTSANKKDGYKSRNY
jgi:ATP-dependent RNA helicase DeaD